MVERYQYNSTKIEPQTKNKTNKIKISSFISFILEEYFRFDHLTRGDTNVIFLIFC
ncbi:hypothetical protein AAJ76_1080006106 [Vairimorpha ceranae]|uniref:Uncharacterized protein n=1 Tax=Vairimorpha ceranae TaxID=40302 RepID=A0A0F9YN75_9MICR|nr:hypothetical protein AAJ76_1080006106 [Vairimorpha ceranae]KKO74162.1 hypothetical protein AAJ76_1080006106 [Vairimorpha ceranae]